MPNRSIVNLQQRIGRTKRDLSALSPLPPGTPSQQYSVCGAAGCRCAAAPPIKHGPYYQLSYTWPKPHTLRARFETGPGAAGVGQLRTAPHAIREWIDRSNKPCTEGPFWAMCSGSTVDVAKQMSAAASLCQTPLMGKAVSSDGARLTDSRRAVP
jgi:hypothetical protein